MQSEVEEDRPLPAAAAAALSTGHMVEAIKYVLKSAGSSLDRVVSVRVYCAKPAFFNQINEVYKKYFPKNPPARTFIPVASWPMEFDVEIECIALE